MKAGTKKRSRVEQSCSHIDSSDYTVSQLRQLLLKVLPEVGAGWRGVKVPTAEPEAQRGEACWERHVDVYVSRWSCVTLELELDWRTSSKNALQPGRWGCLGMAHESKHAHWQHRLHPSRLQH